MNKEQKISRLTVLKGYHVGFLYRRQFFLYDDGVNNKYIETSVFPFQNNSAKEERKIETYDPDNLFYVTFFQITL